MAWVQNATNNDRLIFKNKIQVLLPESNESLSLVTSKVKQGQAFLEKLSVLLVVTFFRNHVTLLIDAKKYLRSAL